jgi:hypothetical protein
VESAAFSRRPPIANVPEPNRDRVSSIQSKPFGRRLEVQGQPDAADLAEILLADLEPI